MILPYGFNAGSDVINDRCFLVPVIQTGRFQYRHEYAAHVRVRLLLVDQCRVHDFRYDTKSRNRYNTFRNVYIRLCSIVKVFVSEFVLARIVRFRWPQSSCMHGSVSVSTAAAHKMPLAKLGTDWSRRPPAALQFR